MNSLQRTTEEMHEAFPDATVAHYKVLIPSLRLPDAGDGNVLAGALRGKADVIVTSNLRDFPKLT